MLKADHADPALTPTLQRALAILEEMTFPELAVLVSAVERKRLEKLETAKHDLAAEFRAKAADMGIAFESLFPVKVRPASRKTVVAEAGKAAIKYRGPGGEEWSGKGRPPVWLTALEKQGRKRDEFVASTEAH